MELKEFKKLQNLRPKFPGYYTCLFLYHDVVQLEEEQWYLYGGEETAANRERLDLVYEMYCRNNWK